MPGFCPFDSWYLENPSYRLAGWIAFLITKWEAGQATLNLIPGGKSVYVTAKVHKFDSLRSAVKQLKLEHDDKKYVYRGQTQRYRHRVEGNVKKLAAIPGIRGPLQFEIESLLPSFARQLFKPTASGTTPLVDWDNWLPIYKLDHAAAAIRAVIASNNQRLLKLAAAACRDTFRQYLVAGKISNIGVLGDSGAVMAGQSPNPSLRANVSSPFAKLIALAQHYDYPSCMVDITRSVQVASWFASHLWSSGNVYQSEGNGVIYRFEPRKLVDLIDNGLIGEDVNRSRATALGVFGHVDLYRLNSHFCPRVQGQEGGALFGLESAVVNLLAFGFGSIELFTFPHAQTTGSESGLVVKDIRPESDPPGRGL